MTQSTLKAQVATAALAVALATFAASVLAQDAGAVPPPVVMTQTAPPPVSMAPPPVVHTVPITSGADSASASSVKVDPAAAAAALEEGASRSKAASAPKPVPKDAAKAPAAPARPAPATSKVTPPEAAPVAAPLSAAAPAPAAVTPPLAQPAPPAPPPAAIQSPGPVEANGWWIGLSLAAAAAALALMAYLARRRPAARHVERTRVEPVAQPVPETMPIAPVVAQSPRVAREPVVEAAPITAGQGGAMGRHEAAALCGPTPDNPFLTRRARVSRARFYDRRERLAAQEGRPMPFAAQRAEAASRAADAKAEQRRAPLTSGWSVAFRPALGES